jgi:hypothetical protein
MDVNLEFRALWTAGALDMALDVSVGTCSPNARNGRRVVSSRHIHAFRQESLNSGLLELTVSVTLDKGQRHSFIHGAFCLT